MKPELHDHDTLLLRSYLERIPAHESPLLISYLTLRKAVGVIGILLPFVLALGNMFLQEPQLQGSISAYYHTPMRDVFVGSLCAIAVFLWAYQGYDWRDNAAGNVAGFAALGVAFFPTTPEVEPTRVEQVLGALHLGAAAIFFATLAYFCLGLFRQTGAGTPTRAKERRNEVYTICGYLIIGCLVAIAGVGVLPEDSPITPLAPVFWLEACAILSFGVSWMIKGEALLKDAPQAPLPR
ncbi:hypothetical protein [Candidatus Chloroploca sp. Khr17]|uniref:hypothetical protein n=1 Tax=Candidatus Chloroploca sp. Khr17 TaxID=2496869 RepID=UPI00196AB115|nr:hypothetical protein [Candidatus Chloroploca sp. Khr17]